jgi:hypothetical protein
LFPRSLTVKTRKRKPNRTGNESAKAGMRSKKGSACIRKKKEEKRRRTCKASRKSEEAVEPRRDDVEPLALLSKLRSERRKKRTLRERGEHKWAHAETDDEDTDHEVPEVRRKGRR